MNRGPIAEMPGMPSARWQVSCVLILGLAGLRLAAQEIQTARAPQSHALQAGTLERSVSLKAGGRDSLSLGPVLAGETYGLQVTLERAPAAVDDRVEVELAGAGEDRIAKGLYAGDPDLYFAYRPGVDGQARLNLGRAATADDRRARCSCCMAPQTTPRG